MAGQLHPDEQTLVSAVSKSVMCQFQTRALQQISSLFDHWSDASIKNELADLRGITGSNAKPHGWRKLAVCGVSFPFPIGNSQWLEQNFFCELIERLCFRIARSASGGSRLCR
jgi:hypothetical protein